MNTVNDFRGCVNELYNELINKRVGAALEALGEDSDYKKIGDEYEALINRIYGEIGFQLGTECETVLSKFFDFQTVAAYKQGFKDARSLEGRFLHYEKYSCGESIPK